MNQSGFQWFMSAKGFEDCLSVEGLESQQKKVLLDQGTLPETNSSPLKMDGWNTIVSYWGPAHFQGL